MVNHQELEHDATYCPECAAEWEELRRDKRSVNDLAALLVWCPGCQQARDGNTPACAFPRNPEEYLANLGAEHPRKAPPPEPEPVEILVPTSQEIAAQETAETEREAAKAILTASQNPDIQALVKALGW